MSTSASELEVLETEQTSAQFSVIYDPRYLKRFHSGFWEINNDALRVRKPKPHVLL